MSGKMLLMKALEQIREEKGLTQAEFAKNELSITRQTYNNWIHGRIEPGKESLEKIVSYLQDESPALKTEPGFDSLTWSRDEIGIMKIEGRLVLIDMNEKIVLNIGPDTVEAAEDLMKSR